MRKEGVLLQLIDSFFIDLGAPSNFSYFWNFGSLLGFCLIIQIITGIFLAMHYCPEIDLAFNSVAHITRDINGGFILRYFHANVALMLSVLVLFVLPYLPRNRFKGVRFKPLSKMFFWLFVVDFLLLTWIGGEPVEEPYILIGRVLSVFYFSYFLIFLPLINRWENKLFSYACVT